MTGHPRCGSTKARPRTAQTPLHDAQSGGDDERTQAAAPPSEEGDTRADVEWLLGNLAEAATALQAAAFDRNLPMRSRTIAQMAACRADSAWLRLSSDLARGRQLGVLLDDLMRAHEAVRRARFTVEPALPSRDWPGPKEREDWQLPPTRATFGAEHPA